MDKIRLYRLLLNFGNKDISNLIVRTLKIQENNIVIDKKRLKNELNLYKYIDKKYSPSLVSALIISILSGKDILDSYNKTVDLMLYIRKKLTMQNYIGVNLLCYFIYNVEDFKEKFSEFNMLSGIKEEEIAFQKEKISIIIKNEDILRKIVLLLDENDIDFNYSILENISKGENILENDNTMEKYFSNILEYKSKGPRDLLGDFNYFGILNSNIGDCREDALIGRYTVTDKNDDYIILNSKRGELKLLIKSLDKKISVENSFENILADFGLNKLKGKWKEIFYEELKKEYFLNLLHKVNLAYKNEIIYPPKSNIFRAFFEVLFENVKVVIIGQDPYHQKDQANGLCFSVYKDVKNPPSLNNIFKELENEYGVLRTDGDLSDWANQGVLMLNSVLTVKSGCAASHAKWGWEIFTDRIVDELGKSEKPIVFILWGNYAINKAKNINNLNHLILKSNHPSPLSCHRGFLGNNHFREANSFLEKNNLGPINWIFGKE